MARIAEEQIDRLQLLTQKHANDLDTAAEALTTAQADIDTLQSDLDTAEAAMTAHAAALTWTEVSTFTNSWVNYGGAYFNAAYAKDTHGWVHLRGVIKNGTDNTSAFTLPSGYRPSASMFFGVGESGGNAGRVIIASDGTVDCHAADSGTDLISLDTIHFYVG